MYIGTYHTQSEAAEYLGLTQPTFNRLVKNGEIKGERVGTGKERIHLLFSEEALDAYQLERIRKKLGKKFDKQFADAQFVAEFFKCLNDGLIAKAKLTGKTDQEALASQIYPYYLTSKNLSIECPAEYLLIIERVFKMYKKLYKDVKKWVDNQIINYLNDELFPDVIKD